MSLRASTSQTFGPFFHIGLKPIAVPIPAGAETLILTGRVTDGDGKPVADACVESWQADPQGRYSQPGSGALPAHSSLHGLGRAWTDDDGRFEIKTYQPGRVAANGGALQAPHLAVCVGLRGLLKHLFTRVYFPGAAGLEDDPVLKLVPAARRATLIARATGPGRLEWNVVLQGGDETVFFDA